MWLASGQSNFCLPPLGQNRGGRYSVNVGPQAIVSPLSVFHATVVIEVDLILLTWGPQAVVSPLSAFRV